MSPIADSESAPSSGVRKAPVDDWHFDELSRRVQEHFSRLTANPKTPLFTTDLADGALFDAYLAAFAPEERQHHNCSCCRTFVQRYGGLVAIGEDGETAPAFWPAENVPSRHVASIEAMRRMLRGAVVKGVFRSDAAVLGQATTNGWHHFSVPNPDVARKGTATAAMAQRREAMSTLRRGIDEYRREVVDQAVVLLEADALYRSDNVLGAARFLQSAMAVRNRHNTLWRLVATAPIGWCSPRASMIGTLLDDLQAGMNFDTVAGRFQAKMHPLLYQRPQAAPTAGNIAAAEKLVASLGIERSLERRFARLDEVPLIWQPASPGRRPRAGGVFGHLRPKAPPSVGLETGPIAITLEKFRREVLSKARGIEVYISGTMHFRAVVTAVHIEAPPILQWDFETARNPFSSYLYHGGSPASAWNLKPDSWVPVTGIMLQPARDPKDLIFILQDCVDQHPTTELALFPENLKSELHAVRATIEAFSKRGHLAERERASACGLGAVGLAKVKIDNGLVYHIDRID